jgi:hypothetical protein
METWFVDFQDFFALLFAPVFYVLCLILGAVSVLAALYWLISTLVTAKILNDGGGCSLATFY